MKKYFLLCILIFITTPTFADILFINLNNSPDEEVAARAAADARHEKLWVFNEHDADQSAHDPLKKKLDDTDTVYQKVLTELSLASATLQKHEDMLKSLKENHPEKDGWISKEWDQHFNAVGGKIKTVEDAIVRLKAKKKQLSDQADFLGEQGLELKSRYESLSGEFDRFLKKMQNSGATISSLVVSGHHSGDRYFGGSLDFGLNDKSLKDALKKYPKVSGSMKALYEWACETGLGTIVEWRNEFPSLKMVLGYEKRGPLAATLADHTILQDALTREAQLLQVQDVKSAQKILNGIKNSSATNLVGAINNCFAGVPNANVKASTFEEAKIFRCKDTRYDLMGAFEDYQKYKEAEEETFLDVPDENSDESTNLIRGFYDRTVREKACYQQFQIKIPPANEIVSLIHFKTILANFQSFFGVNLGTTRHEVLEKIKTLPAGTLKTAALTLLVNLQCDPESWITDIAKKGTKPIKPDLVACKP